MWRAVDPFDGGTYAYFNLVENVDGELRSFVGRYSTDVMAEQTRSLISRFGSRPDPWFIWWTPVAPHHGSPTESDDPGQTRRTDGSVDQLGDPRPTGLGQGALRRADHPRRRHSAYRVGRGDTSDKPRYLRKLPELTLEEREAVTEVTRQRAESLFVLDVQIGTDDLAAQPVGTAREHGHHLHLRQRLLPR